MALASASLYTEISECIPGSGVNVDLGVVSLYSGCSCSGQCGRRRADSGCTCVCAYNQNGRILSEYQEQNCGPIIECNSNCTCDISCPNRTTQRAPSQDVVLTRSSTGMKGVGVISASDLQPGTFIGEYVGELISSSMAKDRLRTLSDSDKCFIVQFREHLSNGKVVCTNIDATSKGNITRFINHSCEPNLVMIPVRSNSFLPRLCLFICKQVEAGEELCFSYFGARESSNIPLGNKKCYCGTSKCVGYLPWDDHTSSSSPPLIKGQSSSP